MRQDNAVRQPFFVKKMTWILLAVTNFSLKNCEMYKILNNIHLFIENMYK